MLDQAAAIRAARPIEWRQADAMQLPFPDTAFDVVVCQFGVMFFPDKVKAFSEARRVLRPGGHFLFNVWDRIEENEFADTVTRALAALFPENPPQFLARIPHGYADVAVVAAELARGGFTRPPTFTDWLRVAVRHRRLCRQLPIAKARRFAANLKLVGLRASMTPLLLPRPQSGVNSEEVLSTAKFRPTSSLPSDKVNLSAVG
jgi:SAM-dependent methyltransferase